jgi:hypothetical protein
MKRSVRHWISIGRRPLPTILKRSTSSITRTRCWVTRSQASEPAVEGKRLSNTPVPGRRFVLKLPHERKRKGFITQTTYTLGSSGVGGRVCEQRYAAERVLPQSAVELRYAESAPERATPEEKEPSSFFGRPVGAGGVGRQEIADPARIELWASRGAAGRASDRRTS